MQYCHQIVLLVAFTLCIVYAPANSLNCHIGTTTKVGADAATGSLTTAVCPTDYQCARTETTTTSKRVKISTTTKRVPNLYSFRLLVFLKPLLKS